MKKGLTPFTESESVNPTSLWKTNLSQHVFILRHLEIKIETTVPLLSVYWKIILFQLLSNWRKSSFEEQKKVRCNNAKIHAKYS